MISFYKRTIYIGDNNQRSVHYQELMNGVDTCASDGARLHVVASASTMVTYQRK